MKVWICAVAKCEELYIREWVEYHKNIGIDHIVIGDNNDDDYEHNICNYIQDYIDEGFVEVFNYHNVLNIQQKFYTYIYTKYIRDFDWFLTIDIDEFVELPYWNNDIHKCLSDERFKQFDAILFTWKAFDDNDKVYYEDAPVRERFVKPRIFHGQNVGIKSIKRAVPNVTSLVSAHCPCIHVKEHTKSVLLKTCTIDGVEYIHDPNLPGNKYSYSGIPYDEKLYNYGFLSHYYTKSTEEYIKYKLLRGRCSRTPGNYILRYSADNYFCFNECTLEKVALFKQYEKNINNKNEKLYNLYNFKIVVCAIAKMEELYIREWIEYYLKIVDKIIIGDNNDIGYEYPLYDVIKDFVESGKVEIVDIQGQKGRQHSFYNDMYNKYKNEYEWFLPLDIDEFLYINKNNPKIGKNLRSVFALPEYRDFDAVVVPWKIYGDNDIVKQKSGKVQKRFKDPVPPKKYIGCKTLYRCKDHIKQIISMHSPMHSLKNTDVIKYCDVLGNTDFERKLIDENTDKFTKIKWKKEYEDIMVLNHYATKSTEEYIKYKIFRGTAIPKYKRIRNTKRAYYSYGNRVTAKKEAMFAKYKDEIEAQMKECEGYDDYAKNILPKFQKYLDLKLAENAPQIWICAVAKCEERYIEEWVQWHKNIGIDHIVIGDNNDSTYEHKLADILKYYIKSGYVEIIDLNDMLNVQDMFYNSIYNKYKGKFEWIFFTDIDEFIEIPKYRDIHEMLYKKQFKDVDGVVFTWKLYDDNDNVYYENKPVKERFTRTYGMRENYLATKMCYRSRNWCNKIISQHCPRYSKQNTSPNGKFIVCDVLGNKNFEKMLYHHKLTNSNADDSFKGIKNLPNYFETAYISHYMWRSTEEFIQSKILRGRADNDGSKDLRYNEEFYFTFNRRTKEKEKLFDKYESKIKEFVDDQLNKYEEFKKDYNKKEHQKQIDEKVN